MKNQENERVLTEKEEMAIQQFIGYRHAAAGFSIEGLAQAMRLKPEEWAVLRTDSIFTEENKMALDKYFNDKDIQDKGER